MHYFAVCYLFFYWNMLFERYFEGLFNAMLDLKIEEGKKKQQPIKFRKQELKDAKRNQSEAKQFEIVVQYCKLDSS